MELQNLVYVAVAIPGLIVFYFVMQWLMSKAMDQVSSLTDTLQDPEFIASVKQRRENQEEITRQWQDALGVRPEVQQTLEPAPEPERPTFPPDALRPEHMMIIGGTGQGKTQYIQELILRDLKSNYPIVVLDSQQSMLEKLLHVVPPDQLMYLDGSTTLSISPFDIGDTSDSIKVSTAISLYENMFEALGTELTTKQATLFRYISRLLIEVPGADFTHALNILRFGVTKYQRYLYQVPEITQQFLTEQLMSKSYSQTREQVAERIYTLLENENFARMFSAPENKADIGKAIRQRKIILINTAQDILGITGASLFGRFCLLQIGLEVLRRPETTDRVYFYVDEAQEYFGDSQVIERIFEQGRKRGLCMICAFHRLGQMSPNLIDLMRTNTSIKVMGGLNSSDAAVLARDTMIDSEALSQTGKLRFAAYAKDGTRIMFSVQPGQLENMPQRSLRDIQSIKNQQHELYGYIPAAKPARQPMQTKIDPDGPQSFD